MTDEVVAFAVAAMRDMNFDVSDVDGTTLLGPAGVDLDSLAVAELALRIEDEYGVKFAAEEMEHVAVMTLGELAAEVMKRRAMAAEGAPT
jgi:acyl carrier protein